MNYGLRFIGQIDSINQQQGRSRLYESQLSPAFETFKIFDDKHYYSKIGLFYQILHRCSALRKDPPLSFGSISNWSLQSYYLLYYYLFKVLF